MMIISRQRSYELLLLNSKPWKVNATLRTVWIGFSNFVVKREENPKKNRVSFGVHDGQFL